MAQQTLDETTTEEFDLIVGELEAEIPEHQAKAAYSTWTRTSCPSMMYCC